MIVNEKVPNADNLWWFDSCNMTIFSLYIVHRSGISPNVVSGSYFGVPRITTWPSSSCSCHWWCWWSQPNMLMMMLLVRNEARQNTENVHAPRLFSMIFVKRISVWIFVNENSHWNSWMSLSTNFSENFREWEFEGKYHLGVYNVRVYRLRGRALNQLR